jgi:4-coumarate--CoA ligase
LLIVHPLFLSTALSAARKANIPTDRIILIDSLPSSGTGLQAPPTVEDLINYGLSETRSFRESQLSAEEGKTKLAFLSFSSGTTGRPKAVAIPHYAVIANVIQMAKHWRVNEDYTTWENKQWRAGDVAMAGKFTIAFFDNTLAYASNIVLPFFRKSSVAQSVLHWLMLLADIYGLVVNVRA